MIDKINIYFQSVDFVLFNPNLGTKTQLVCISNFVIQKSVIYVPCLGEGRRNTYALLHARSGTAATTAASGAIAKYIAIVGNSALTIKNTLTPRVIWNKIKMR